MRINFLGEEHIDRYEAAKEQLGFKENIGEYASFTYLLTSNLLYKTCSKVFYPKFDIVKAFDILENDKMLSVPQQIMLKLALDLYRCNYKGDSIIQVFSAFDEINKKVALEALKIEFSIFD